MYAPIQIASVTDQVGYSSSLVDTSIFLYQVVEFWNNLGWSCPEETYTFMMELINVSTTKALEVCNMYLTFIWTGSLYGVVVWQMWVVLFGCFMYDNTINVYGVLWRCTLVPLVHLSCMQIARVFSCSFCEA